ncbi:MAG TPA: hypothetical protein VMA30_09035 [Xanthobacteraceae bacterium]|nr:hypothetical protein [Xanthobacteraceae bacterium]
MTTLKDIEQHVLDDAAELIASIGVATPLTATTRVFELQGDQQKVALFLRATLCRHVILVTLRLHARADTGRTGETASIESYVQYAEREGRISATQAAEFRTERKAIIAKIERDGIKFSELVDFRNSELAHSLHCPQPLTNKLPTLPIWDFAYDTYELVLRIEMAVSGTGRLKNYFHEWLNRGNLFWPQEVAEDFSLPDVSH